MDTPHRIPLQDLPLEHLTHGTITASKTPRKHKRPLSPSCTPLNPAKRRVLDAEGIPPSSSVAISSRLHPTPFMLSNMLSVTPTRTPRLGDGHLQSHGRSQGTRSPLSSQRSSPFREPYPKPTTESSTDPQSRHYPGFDIFRDSEQRRGSPGPRVTLPSGDALVDRSEEDKENVPLRRKAKKPSSKKRLLSGLDGLDPSCPTSAAQTSRMVDQAERTPFSTCQALR